MTDEEVVKQLEIIVGEQLDERSALAKRVEAWHEESREAWNATREAMGSIRESVIALKASIDGAGGIVGQNVCDAREIAIVRRVDEVEKRQEGFTTRLWALLVGVLLSIMGMAGALFIALHKAGKP